MPSQLRVDPRANDCEIRLRGLFELNMNGNDGETCLHNSELIRAPTIAKSAFADCLEPDMKFLYWLLNFVIRVFTRAACRIDAPDLQEKIPPGGPLIVITNHTGQLEVPMLYAHLQPRKMTGWAKIETWNHWFLKHIFTLWDLIPVRRGEADTSALKKALSALKDGYIFGLAPEGTRNKTGRLRRALPGAVIVALHSGVPIVPLAHWGGEKFLPNLKRFKRTDFHIRVGKPFRLNTDGVKVTGEVRQQIVDDMMFRIAALLPEEYRGEYSDLSKETGMYIRDEG